MTEIHFYSQVADKLAVACRIAGKARTQNLRVLISLSDPAETEKLDRMLWVAPALSFIPHCISGHELAAETPVLLRHSQTSDSADVLINLAPGAAADFSRFDRVVELVGTEQEDLEDSRVKWRFYRDSGCVLRNHRMSEAD